MTTTAIIFFVVLSLLLSVFAFLTAEQMSFYNDVARRHVNPKIGITIYVAIYIGLSGLGAVLGSQPVSGKDSFMLDDLGLAIAGTVGLFMAWQIANSYTADICIKKRIVATLPPSQGEQSDGEKPPIAG